MSPRPCPLCGSPRRFAFLERARVPVFQNAPMLTVEAAKAIPTGGLHLVFCLECTFIGNDAFEPELVAYGAQYENDQCHSAVFEEHVGVLVRDLVASGLTGRRVLEVGCGAGHFLRRLCRDGRNTGVGFDPAYRGPETDLGGAVRFVADYYREGPRAAAVDAVVSRHVIEHVPEPAAFVRLLRGALRGDAGGRLYLETPAVEWILERGVVQDFFYEHCSYFSSQALRLALESAGLRVHDQRTLFGGQYQWVEAVPCEERQARPVPREEAGRLAAVARAYGAGVERRLEALRARLERLASTGPVALWGAGAKGVTLVNLVDPDRRLVTCLVDINPRKQERFVPGTGHAIVAPAAIPSRRVRHVVVVNPNYEVEVATALREVDPTITIQVSDTP